MGAYYHYGWIDYSGTGDAEGTVHGWAYESTQWWPITVWASHCCPVPAMLLLLLAP